MSKGEACNHETAKVTTMSITLPSEPHAPVQPPSLPGFKDLRSIESCKLEPKPTARHSCNFGIELAVADGGNCELCNKPGGYPFAGFLSLAGGERVRLCDVCLFEEAAPLGLVLAGTAFLRKVGRVSLPENRRKMAAEIATFARVFETILTRRFGPAPPSQLLEHFADVGGLGPRRYPPSN